MTTLPQLIEEDIHQLDQILQELITSSESTTALVIDKGGFLITHRGESRKWDLTTIAALACGSYLANQTIANLIDEKNFDSVYQQGETNSMFVLNIDEYCLMVLIFRATISAGAVKFFAISAGQCVAHQLELARKRNPDGGLDLSVLNIADTSEVFRRTAV